MRPAISAALVAAGVLWGAPVFAATIPLDFDFDNPAWSGVVRAHAHHSSSPILAFVAMKMERSWRDAPFRNSGFRKLKPFAGYFTHGS